MVYCIDNHFTNSRGRDLICLKKVSFSQHLKMTNDTIKKWKATFYAVERSLYEWNPERKVPDKMPMWLGARSVLRKNVRVERRKVISGEAVKVLRLYRAIRWSPEMGTLEVWPKTGLK